MSLFGTLLSKILPHRATQASGTLSPRQPAETARPGQQESAGVVASATRDSQSPASASSQTGASNPLAVDVEQVLDGMARQRSPKLSWRTSIVDLMKLVGMDSSLQARKQLAQELNYTGDLNDSASMNIWLHKQVMKKIAENGGKVPADLLH
jgi:hypothetical protein